MKSDDLLIQSFRTTGRAEHLEELAGRYVPEVRAMIGRMVFDCDLADDLTQDVFLQALRGIDSFRINRGQSPINLDP